MKTTTTVRGMLGIHHSGLCTPLWLFLQCRAASGKPAFPAMPVWRLTAGTRLGPAHPAPRQTGTGSARRWNARIGGLSGDYVPVFTSALPP